MPLDNRQKRIAKLKDSGDLFLFKEIEALESKIPDLDKILVSVRGTKGEDAIPEEVADILLSDKAFKDSVKGDIGDKGDKGDFTEGKDGEDATLPKDFTIKVIQALEKKLPKANEVDFDKIKRLINAEVSKIELPDFVELIEKSLPELPKSILQLEDTPEEYSPGHILLSKEDKFEYYPIGELTKQVIRGGGGNVEIFNDGTKVGSGSAINFIGADSITHDGHRAVVNLSGGSGGSGDVTAGSNLGNNLLIRGDGSTKGVQNTGITINDTDSISGIVNISLSGTVDGIDVATDVAANTAKLTANTTNVTNAGALMDSELASIADVKALDQSVINGASPVFTTTNMTDASNKRFVTDAQEAKIDYLTVTQAVDLDQMETDIDALANGMVYKGDWDASAGTFPGSGSAQIGWFYYISVAGTVDSVSFAVGDNIIAVTDDASASTYASNWSKHDQTDAVQAVVGLTGSVSKGSLLAALNVEDGADVTDTTNVTSAGALMDSEVTNLADVKAFDTTDYATSAQGATADSAMQDLVDDTTPQLGGNLDTQGNIILGGTSTTADLNFQTTTGVGAAGADMHFLVGNNGATEAMTVLNSGNVGIGTASPDYNLEIQKTSTVANAVDSLLTVSYDLSDTPSNGDSFTSAVFSGDITNAGMGYLRLEHAYDSTTASRWSALQAGTNFPTHGDGPGALSGDTGHLLLNPYGGNVGIGTTAPAYQLEVASDTGGIAALSTNGQPGSNASPLSPTLNFLGYTDVVRGSISVQDKSSNQNGGWMQFKTADSSSTLQDRMIIDSSGNVGIGTTAPTASLQINGSNGLIPKIRIMADEGGYSAVTQTVPTGLDISTATLISPSASFGNGIRFLSHDSSFTTTNPKFLAGIFPQATESYSADTDSGMALTFYTTTNNAGVTPTPSQRMIIDEDGNVGIGTTTPGALLHVYGTGSRVAVFGDIGAPSGTATPTNVSFGSTFGTNSAGNAGNLKWDVYTNSSSSVRYGIGMSSSLMEFQAGAGGGLGFFVNNGANAMRIDSSGNVGIGTTAPNQPLTVEGTMSLKEQASANADTASYGQIWVKTATPNQLWFTDDAGGDSQVKMIAPRVSSETSSATPTINVDNVEAHSVTALATAVTSMTSGLSGTPVNFQKLVIRFKDNGTARAISWGSSFEDAGQALPTTTVVSKLLTVGLFYNTVTSKWGCVAVGNET